MKTSNIYPSQFAELREKVGTLNPADLAIGAPFSPLPKSFYRVNPRLAPAQPLATEAEIQQAISDRGKFRVGNYGDPYVADVLRAFRLIAGKKFYLEIGIFDRGNLSYVASLLDPNAVLIGLDIQHDAHRDELLRSTLQPGQTYHSVIGSSRDSQSVGAVAELLGDNKLDGIFIDGDHTAYAALSDFALYEDFVSDDGIILFHDSVWEGDESYKGVCDALDEISRVEPIYMIDGANPIRRFCRPVWRDTLWGVVAVIFASEQAWRIQDNT